MKLLEIIDRDISEIRDIEKKLSSDRTYSNAIKISLELQINNLLNKKIKLMELKIDDPPDHLKAIEKNYQSTYHRKSTPFGFEERENTYLPKLLNREDDFLNENENESNRQEKSKPYTNYEQAPSPRISLRRNQRKNLSPRLLEKKTGNSEEKIPPDEGPGTKGILKRLPTLED